MYRRHGVREYIVWRVLENAIDWFVLRDGHYEPLHADETGVLGSEVFPGLWLDAAAMIRGDTATVLKVLGEGLASHFEAGERCRISDVLRTCQSLPATPIPRSDITRK